jgi:hypothetical protein
MAPMVAMFKTSLLVAALLAMAPMPGHAATFSAKRGINLDIWTAWPGEDQWDKPDVILPYPEWRKHLGEAELRALKEAGFDFVRIPVDPSPFLSPKTEALRGELFASVRDSARLVNAAGLKAIVDMHLIPRGEDSPIGMEAVMADPAVFEAYVAVLREMARTLSKEDPALVALELMNEPVVDCEGDGTNLWPDRQSELFAAARASATRLTLVLTGACYSGAEGLSAVDPRDYPDDNIIWGFHSYKPFLLTHQGATWAGDFIRYVTGIPYPPYSVPRETLDAAITAIKAHIDAEAPWSRRAGMSVYLDEQIAEIDTPERLDAVVERPFVTVAEWAETYDIDPKNILLGEFGMIRQEYGNPYVVPAASRAAYVKDMIGRAERHGFSWAIWDYGGAFGIVEEFEGRNAEPDVMDVVKGLE